MHLLNVDEKIFSLSLKAVLICKATEEEWHSFSWAILIVSLHIAQPGRSVCICIGTACSVTVRIHTIQASDRVMHAPSEYGADRRSTYTERLSTSFTHRKSQLLCGINLQGEGLWHGTWKERLTKSANWKKKRQDSYKLLPCCKTTEFWPVAQLRYSLLISILSCIYVVDYDTSKSII